VGRSTCFGSSVGGVGLEGRGTDAERAVSGSRVLLVLAVGSISPLAVAILFVNDEMAQPAQELSLGVPTRASGLLTSAGAAGGRTVSGIVLAYFRVRWTYKSSVLFAWSRINLFNGKDGVSIRD
jgi:hypothetical protein